MRPVRRIIGRAAVLDRTDVDTDQIMPKQFLKRIERTGFGRFLFYDWAQDPDFELNRPETQGANILLAGRNFGCGSSREHAPWALQDYGFEAVVAPSFGDIFRTNCVKIGLLPVVLAPDEVKSLMQAVGRGVGSEMTVDLEEQTVTAPDGRVLAFEFDAFERHCLVNGLDDIARALEHEREIAQVFTSDRRRLLVRLSRAADAVYPKLDALPQTLLHHDVWLPNLGRVDGKTALIDWSYAGPGTPGADLSQTVALMIQVWGPEMDDEALLAALYAGLTTDWGLEVSYDDVLTGYELCFCLRPAHALGGPVLGGILSGKATMVGSDSLDERLAAADATLRRIERGVRRLEP